MIGVDLRTVSAYDGLEYAPSPDTMQKIQSVLGFPMEFFYGDDLDEPTPDTASFRAMSKMSAPQRDMALSQGALAFHFSDWIEARFDLPDPQLPDLSREPDPEIAAQSLRRLWNLGELSIRNVLHLVESKGVRVFSLAVDSREVDAFSLWENTRPFIFVNTRKSAEHARFDVAHELGHLVLHRHSSPHGREAEQQADVFASAFLMPEGSMRVHALRFPTISSLMNLKKVWGVSMIALIHRLHEVGLISDWHYRTLCIEITKRGYRDSEPEGLPREGSLILQRVMASLSREGITRSQIAKELCLPTSEVEQLMFNLAITGIDGGGGKPRNRIGSGRAQTGLKRVK